VSDTTCVWDWHINGIRCTIDGIRSGPNGIHKFYFYGPEWIALNLFPKSSVRFFKRYE
jgi:hypothetical protein